jgi:hypothetical protein
MESLDHPLLSQAAALLCSLLTHVLSTSCKLEQIEAVLQRLSQEVARRAAEQYAQLQADAAEQSAPVCSCGLRMVAEQRRQRAVLLLFGLIHFHLRRYRCSGCGAWCCPGAEQLELGAKQRMTRPMQEIVTHFGLSWSYQVAAVLLGRVLPVAAVSAKTVERVTKQCARRRQAQEDAEAIAGLEPPSSEEARQASQAKTRSLPPFEHPKRVYIGLDGILVRGRAVKSRFEIQVGSLWSAWKDLPDRKHPRREIKDRVIVARALGWEKLGAQVWRLFVARGGLQAPRPEEVVVLGDGASGIRSLWELYFPFCRALLDPWHLWEKVKDRAREVLGHRERGLGAAQVVYDQLKRGAIDEARERIELWPAATEWGRGRRDRLLAYLERNRDLIGDYEALRASGYMTGSGLTEKANDLVVVPRMKNGKMHWSRAGANAVALLRAHVLNDPEAPLLPT